MRLSANRIWQQLPEEVRIAASAVRWAEPNKTQKEVLIAVIAKSTRTREVSVRRAALPRLIRWTAACVSLPDDIADGILRDYLLHNHRGLIVRFLDSLRIPHRDGLIDDDFDPSLLTKESIQQAARSLLDFSSDPAAELYLQYLSVQCGQWSPIEEILPTHNALGETLFETSDPIEREQVNPQEDRLSNLDQTVLSAIEDCVSGAQYALTHDQIQDMLDELLQLSPQRAKSWFHQGYFDASLGTLAKPLPPLDQAGRQLWYLAGAVISFSKRGESKRIVHLFDTADLKPFGRELDSRSKLAAKAIFAALCEESRFDAALDILTPKIVFYADLFEESLRWGTKLLRQMDIHAALSIFEVLDNATAELTGEQRQSLGASYFEVKRRKAHCLRMQRHFRESKRVLTELLDDPAAPERSSMTTDLAMITEGFRGLYDVCIPDDDSAVSEFVRKLNRIRPELENALTMNGGKGHALYCLGVLAVAERRDPDSAARSLDISTTHMLRNSTVYNRGDLLSRVKFYMSLAWAESLNSAFSPKSRALFEESVAEGFVPPSHLFIRLLEALSMTSADETRHVGEIAIGRLPARKKVIEAILASGIASASPAILTAVLDWARNPTLSGKKSFTTLRQVLSIALAAQQVEIAAEALDGMESLALQGVSADEFLTILNSPDSYFPAWSESDAAWSSAFIHEMRGEFPSAAALLGREFHRLLSEDDHGAMDQAEDILNTIRRFGVAGLHESLADRLAACRESDSVTSIQAVVDSSPVLVTVVGGDEKQMKLDDEIRGSLRARFPFVSLEFRHTFWNSNHGEQLKAMEPLLRRSDAVVVMRRIRTNLGRNLRRICPLWVGCAGDSRSSIERAIQMAVGLARTKKKSRTKIFST